MRTTVATGSVKFRKHIILNVVVEFNSHFCFDIFGFVCYSLLNEQLSTDCFSFLSRLNCCHCSQRSMILFFFFFLILKSYEVSSTASVASTATKSYQNFISFAQTVFFIDGKYCLTDTNNSFACTHSVTVNTKHPYVIIRFDNEKVAKDDHIYVIKPSLWPDISPDQELLAPLSPTHNNTQILMQFTIHNITKSHSLFKPSSSPLLFTMTKIGLLFIKSSSSSKPLQFKRIESHSLEQMLQHHLCDANDLLPGNWAIDRSFLNHNEHRWNSCPIQGRTNPRRAYYNCPKPYYASQYYSDSNCFTLPLRVSWQLLFHYFEKKDILHRISQAKKPSGYKYFKPYYTFIGDSLGGQVAEAALCELENHGFLSNRRVDELVHGKDKVISRHNHKNDEKRFIEESSLSHNDIDIHFMWNQYLRNDLPCQPQCITNETYRLTEGKQSKRYYLPSTCRGCPNGERYNGSLSNHPEFFHYLKKIPKEAKMIIINGGAWFTEYFLVSNGTNKLQDTLQALIPLLAELQRERNNTLDFYFITLPPVQSYLAKTASFEWGEYLKRNEIIYQIFSRVYTIKYNVTVTVIPNDQLFSMRKKKEDHNAITTPDVLHYCVPGVFSPPSFLLELIFHFHTLKQFKQIGVIQQRRIQQ